MISFSHFLPELELMPEKRALDAYLGGHEFALFLPMGFCLTKKKKAFPPYNYQLKFLFIFFEDLR